jgi:sortase A
MHGPGHRRDTVLPGQAGVSVIFGRRTAFGGPFRRIPDLRPGDIVTATTGQTTAPAKYRVTAVRDSRSLVSQPADTTPNELMLVTAAPPLTPTHSTIVTAQLLTAPQPSASAVPSISPTETALSTDASAWQALAWWALLLLVISLAMSWAYLRWSRWPAYVLSTPVLLAVLWNVFENLARLLPNLL